MANLGNDYLMVKINDNRKRLQTQIETKMSSFNRHYVECVDGRDLDSIIKFFNNNPEIKETRPMRYGYIGHWLTFLNIFKYMVNNNIESLIVLEDDAVLSETFIDDLKKYMQDVPEDYDFFMAYQSLPAIHNCVFPRKRLLSKVPVTGQSSSEFGTIHPDWQIGSKLVLRAYQTVGSVGQVFSLSGAKKFLELTEKNGLGTSRHFLCSFDQAMYIYSKSGIVDGYQPSPYSGIKKLITIEKSIPDTDTQTQLQGTKRVELDKLLGIENV